MKLNVSNKTISALVFILFLIPMATSSLLDLEQDKVQAIALKQEKTLWEASKKIYLTGKFDPPLREDFVVIPSEHLIGIMSGSKMYLRKETFSAFSAMAERAASDGIELKIASATRNFDYQKNLWNKKWSGETLVDGKDLSKTIPDGTKRLKKILEYSAIPGASRHHWGTDIDINNANVQYFDTEKGKREYEWLLKNARYFGFCQTYNLKGSARPTGFNEEKWHWSYLPIAKALTQDYKDLIKNDDLTGFLGSEYAVEQNLIENYVLGINPKCL